MSGPLDGVRVLDLSRLLPGPYATLVLSELGAEVIKVEDNKGGDYARYYPPLASDGTSAIFHALNRGKKSVALNLKDDADKASFLALVKTADVVLESFRPGVLEKLGLGPETLAEANPKIVVCRISGYGQEGPYRERAGHDINYAARAGALGMMKDPTPLPVQIGDLAGGAWPAVAQILAALLGRERTGEGAVIDVSMTDWARAMLLMPQSKLNLPGEQPPVVGGGHDWLVGAVPCYSVYKTKDGHYSVGALEPKFWFAFCQAAGLEDLADSGHVEGKEADRVKGLIAARMAEKTNAEWDAILGPADCCCEAVLAPEQAIGPQATIRIGDDDVKVPALPLSLGAPKTAPAPGLGADEDLLSR
jgi:alpha-methylacyl-CoA racemase